MSGLTLDLSGTEATMTGSATTIDINYDVPLVEQPDGMTCWAAALAMVRSYQEQASYTVDDIAGPEPHSWMNWSQIEPIAIQLGFVEIASAGLMPTGWHDLLAAHGPLWIVIKADVSSQASHAVVLTGMAGDGSVDGTQMLVNNPTGVRETPSFTDFAARWDLGAVAGASIFAPEQVEAESTDSSASDGSTEVQESQPEPEPEPEQQAPATQEDFEAAFQAVEPEIDDSEVAVIEPPEGDEAIAGEIADVVNAGVQLIKLVANSSSVTLVKDGYAHALPAGVGAENLSGWQPNKRVISFRTDTTPWWSFWNVDWRATILVTYMYGGNADGTGAYVDQVHVALDDVVLPPDFSFDVEAAFPATGLRMTPPTVGAIQCTLTLRLKGLFGQLLSGQRSMVMLILGTGAIQDV